VHAIPTPWQDKLLLEEHGVPPEDGEEELGVPYEVLGEHGYAP
jgi:hypothetical protein